MTTSPYHCEYNKGRLAAGYTRLMVWLTPSAQKSLDELLRLFPEQNRTDIVCLALKKLCKEIPE